MAGEMPVARGEGSLPAPLPLHGRAIPGPCPGRQVSQLLVPPDHTTSTTTVSLKLECPLLNARRLMIATADYEARGYPLRGFLSLCMRSRIIIIAICFCWSYSTLHTHLLLFVLAVLGRQ